jgi:hypothetical protein
MHSLVDAERKHKRLKLDAVPDVISGIEQHPAPEAEAAASTAEEIPLCVMMMSPAKSNSGEFTKYIDLTINIK